MTEPELDALIERNEARKAYRSAMRGLPYNVTEDYCDCEWICNCNPWASAIWSADDLMIAELCDHGMNLPTAQGIVAACNDRPEDDIDQLLAHIADLQGFIAGIQ